MAGLEVTVVIPVFNGAETIGRTLEALSRQDFDGRYEVIVVDDGSVDATPGVVSSFPSVRYLRQDNAGPAAARNAGVRAAYGTFVLFTDADCAPRPDWISRLVAGFSSGSANIAAVCGTYGIANPQSFLARGIHAEILFRHQNLVPDFPMVFGSYNVALKRDIFLKLGGFDEGFRHASGEDNDLSYRVLHSGQRIFFARGAVVDHHHTEFLSRYLKEQYRHGFWRVRMYLRYPVMAGGDDYTFWKDMAEVPLSAMTAAALIGILARQLFAGQIFLLVLVAFFSLEAGFGLRVMGEPVAGLRWGAVMFLRSFARTAGFVAGTFSTFFGGDCRKQTPPGK